MISRRTLINLGVFLGVSVLLIAAGTTQLVLGKGGGRTLVAEFADAGGLAPRNDVTMRGVPVGVVSDVTLTDRGLVEVRVKLERGVEVPEGTVATVTRRSSIGDITLELTPGDGPAMPEAATIGLADTKTLPDAERTIEILARVLRSVPSQDLSNLVSELATGVAGRGEDLGTLAQAGADIPERLLEVKAQLESLIVNGPKVTGVFAENAETLADDVTVTAMLADILRDRRFDLVELMRNGGDFAVLAGGLLADEKANLSCLVSDFGDLNATLAAHLGDLEGTLELNHFFFDGVWISVQKAKDGLLDWFRVHLLAHEEPPGRAYQPARPAPDVFPGKACTSRYGRGVGPVNQAGPFFLAHGSELK